MTSRRVQNSPALEGASKADPDQHLLIGDLAASCGVTMRAIRFYEAKGLLRPQRVGKARVYSRKDRARLMIILRGKNLGFSLEDIADYLRLYDADPAQIAQTKLLLEKVEGAIADLQRKRMDLDRTLRELEDIQASCIAHLKTKSAKN